MAIFPTDDPAMPANVRKIRPLYGYQSGWIENVKRNDAEQGDSSIIDVWVGRMRFYADMQFDRHTDEFSFLYNFWKRQRGSAFTFFDFEEEWQDTFLQIGTNGGGAPATVVATIPAKEVRNVILKVNAAIQTEGVNYTILRNTGALGEDQASVVAVPAGGVVTVTYMGRWRHSCEFPEAARKNTNRYRAQNGSFKVRGVNPVVVT